jgi:hypothetical protein
MQEVEQPAAADDAVPRPKPSNNRRPAPGATDTPEQVAETEEQKNARVLAEQEARSAARRDAVQRRFDEMTARDKAKDRQIEQLLGVLQAREQKPAQGRQPIKSLCAVRTRTLLTGLRDVPNGAPSRRPCSESTPSCRSASKGSEPAPSSTRPSRSARSLRIAWPSLRRASRTGTPSLQQRRRRPPQRGHRVDPHGRGGACAPLRNRPEPEIRFRVATRRASGRQRPASAAIACSWSHRGLAWFGSASVQCTAPGSAGGIAWWGGQQ